MTHSNRTRVLFPLMAASLLGAGAGCGVGADDQEPLGSASFATYNCGGVPEASYFGANIDPLAAKAPQSSCGNSPKPGVVGFRDFVLSLYPCTTDMGISRSCYAGGTSEHKEGRAWDWGVNTKQDASMDFLAWLLATDVHGNKYAMARRFGIMYMIFNGKIWTAYDADKGWQRYTGSDAHRWHVHFSFSWDGAMQRTSYWTEDPLAPENAPGPYLTDQGVPPPVTPRFIGKGCTGDSMCSSGQCFTEAGSDMFTDGMCTQTCTTYCPDKYGEPTTLCVAFDPVTGTFSGNQGYCFAGCDFSAYPSTGCRAGYTCAQAHRRNDSSVTRDLCLPDTGELPPQPPSFIGGVCAEDAGCSDGGTCVGAPIAAQPGVDEPDPTGTCVVPCDLYCPDKAGEPTTFCVAYDLATGQYAGNQGQCFSRCDQARFPGTGCRPGHDCVKMPRNGQPSVKRNVCLRNDGKADLLAVGEPPDAEGDLPNPEQALTAGCQVGPRPAVAFPWFLAILAVLALAWRFGRSAQT